MTKNPELKSTTVKKISPTLRLDLNSIRLFVYTQTTQWETFI